LVSTIHGVLNQFIRTHGSLIGLDRQFQISKNHEQLVTEILHHQLETRIEMQTLVAKYGWRSIRNLFLDYHRAYMFNNDIAPLSIEAISSHWDTQIQTLRKINDELFPYIAELSLAKKSETLRKLCDSLEALDKALRATTDRWEKLAALHRIRHEIPTRLGALAGWAEHAKENRQNLMDLLNQISGNPWTDLKTLLTRTRIPCSTILGTVYKEKN
jgi:superfamily I DNA/RNA helicase